ncbi:hypothetical protein LTR29_000610 [Friedmanniomyces endolithicus]|nr:hypothetical protein LTR29_000610 [Friedmanniomyces endolithicus]
MKILDAGTQPLSNQDVLTWVASKRAQHTAENSTTKGKGKGKDQQPSTHPSNFLASLTKHERELKDPKKYPYVNNPTAYNGTFDAMRKFDELLLERIYIPLEDKYRETTTMTAEEAGKALGKEQDEKTLTETEQLMLFNHAPQGVEQLQPMLENCEERFTAEEQQVLVDCVMEVYRGDEMGRKGEGGRMIDIGERAIETRSRSSTARTCDEWQACMLRPGGGHTNVRHIRQEQDYEEATATQRPVLVLLAC